MLDRYGRGKNCDRSRQMQLDKDTPLASALKTTWMSRSDVDTVPHVEVS